jgi:hypothetical protein
MQSIKVAPKTARFDVPLVLTSSALNLRDRPGAP